METTPRTAATLAKILEERGWDQAYLASLCGLKQPQISQHITKARPIRDTSLKAYCSVLGAEESPRLVAAWLRDMLDETTLEAVLAPDGNRLHEEVAVYGRLASKTDRMLDFLKREARTDEGLEGTVQWIAVNAGYEDEE